MSTTPRLVNAWIFLNEDEPKINGVAVGYNDPRSSYQRLIKDNIYQSVDMLNICFAVTVPTSETTVPQGNGDYYTLEMGSCDSHPDGLTNQDYMDYVLRDAKANNPNIKFMMTLLWGNGDTITNIFANTNNTPQENADHFAANLLAYLEHYNLDGFDIDWEYPISVDTTQEQFKMLFTAIGKVFKAQKKKYYLTLSPASVDNLDAPTVNDYFDFVNLQLYSGFTFPGEFTRAGVNKDLFAYGAKFESGYETANQAYTNGTSAGYNTWTQWRLNSDNFEYEQDQQVKLFQLVHSDIQ